MCYFIYNKQPAPPTQNNVATSGLLYSSPLYLEYADHN